jgi:glycosyltransferase involved in cell wall biosynthesis
MLKEYYHFSRRNISAIILTQNTIPDAYFKEFMNIGSDNCIVVTPNTKGKKEDISDFLPGVKASMNGSFLNNVISLTRYLRIRNFSIIIAHQLLSALILMPYSVMHRKPFLLVLHDNPFLFFKKNNLKKMSLIRRFEATLIYLLSNIVIFASKSTVCTTPQIKEEVESNLKIHKALLVAEYGIDTFPVALSSDRDIILTVSKWSEFRNPTAYLDLLDLLPIKTKLVMVGRWDTEAEFEKFRAEVIRRALGERLILRENVSEGELSYFYDKTRVFVRLGFGEKGTGQAILEAIGHGCPVVISRGLGASTMVLDGETGFLVDENNLVDVADKVITIFSNDEVVDKMSKCAYEIARKHSWQAYLNSISTLAE